MVTFLSFVYVLNGKVILLIVEPPGMVSKFMFGYVATPPRSGEDKTSNQLKIENHSKIFRKYMKS